MAKKVTFSKIVVGQEYGILTFAGASTGLWTIAKIVSVEKDKCMYEIPNGQNDVQLISCKPSEVFNKTDCAAESIAHRPEYAKSFQKYL